ncbi:MAG TPA: dTDP-4-dehydrorhamnose 3,5-epimerase [Polyangia bacterium]|jgi:dTDP-4-dehydrorhamnose 3,5-epimerase|nr:dTDP-4-dehydrorhamnose 3,5-epimerase [Polyangia bacterium]
MEVIQTEIPGVLLIKPRVFGDARGFFVETFQAARYASNGMSLPFVQDNVSRSQRGVLRGLHMQQPHAQGKLVSVPSGEVFDVAVDVRVGSPTFGRWVGMVLSGENQHQVYIPPGLAHGFCALRDDTLFSYKCTDLYHPECEVGIRWDDPDIGIKWPLESPLVSGKDQALPLLKDVDRARLASYEALGLTG